MSLQPGTRFGAYVVVRSLGGGAMGEVFEARDTRLDRKVAIKTLRRERRGDSQAQRRFEREAKALSSLNHPNICTVFDVGTHATVDYIVMEYIDGRTLSAVLETERLDESALVRIRHPDRRSARGGARPRRAAPARKTSECHRDAARPREGARLRPGKGDRRGGGWQRGNHHRHQRRR